MATVKNFNLAGVSDNVQFGKAGGKIDFSGGAFTVTDSGGTPVALTAATPAAANDSTLVATTAFVATELANFDDTTIVSADGFSSVVAGDSGAVTIDADDNASGGSLVVTVGTVGQYTVTNGKFDISESAGVQLSAANGTEAAPAIAFDAAAGEEAGLFFDPDGAPGTNTLDQVGISVDGVAIQKWRVENDSTGTDYIVTEAGDGEARMVAEGATSNIDIRLVPKGVGQVYLGDQGSAASISSSDATAASGFAGEDLSINAGDGDGAGDGGNIFMAPGADGGSGSDGAIELRDYEDNAVMIFHGDAAGTAVNYFDVTNAATGSNLNMQALGTDTDISIELFAKGAGDILVQTGYAPTVDLALATKGYVDGAISGGNSRIQDGGDTTYIDTDEVANTITMVATDDITMAATADITMGGVNLDVNMSGTVDIDGTAVHIGGSAASDITVAAAMVLETSGSNTLGVNAPGSTLSLSGADVNTDATAGISLTAATASDFTTAAGDLTLSAADDLNLTGSTSVAITGALFSADMTGAITLDSDAASNFTTSAGAITVDSAAALNLTASSGDVVFSATGDIDAGTNTIKNVVDPTNDQDAATKSYVDGVASGLDVKESSHQGTTANLAAAYDNGTLGLGATLTASVPGVWPAQDGHYFGGVGSRVLVKDQTVATQNGIYTITDAGAGEEVTEIVTVNGLAGTEYFTFSDGASAAFYVWFDLDDGSADPTPGGTGIEANIATGHTVTDVRDAAIAAINASAADATAYVDEDDIFYIVNGTAGTQTDATAGTSGFTVTVTSEGAAATAWELTRAEDADNSPSNEVSGGMFVFIEDGESQANTGWVLSEPNGDAVLGTDDLVFTQFSGAGAITVIGGDGITVTTAGTDYTIDANTDDVTIRINGSDNMAIGGANDDTNKVILGAAADTDAAWGYLGDLRDSNGELTLSSVATASAVNYFEMTNAALAGEPVLAAAGADTDINITLTPKGAGIIDASTSLISNVTDPVSAQDAATMQYVDDSVGAVSATDLLDGDSSLSLSDAGNTLTMTFDSSNQVFQVTGTLFDVDVAISAADGSAAAPAYTFDTETDDGLYYTTNGGIAVSDSGVEAMELGLTGGHASLTALGTNINVVLIPTGTGFVNASSSLISNVTDPVGDQDAATKKYVDDSVATSTENDVRSLKETVSFSGAQANVAFTDTIPAGSTITRISLSVTTIADSTVTFTVGDGTTLDRYMGTLENDPEGLGLYLVDLQNVDGSAITPSYTVSAGSGAGVATIMVEYRSA